MCFLTIIFLSPERNSKTPQPSTDTLVFSSSTSFAVISSSIDTLSTIVKPTETINLGKMLLKE